MPGGSDKVAKLIGQLRLKQALEEGHDPKVTAEAFREIAEAIRRGTPIPQLLREPVARAFNAAAAAGEVSTKGLKDRFEGMHTMLGRRLGLIAGNRRPKANKWGVYEACHSGDGAIDSSTVDDVAERFGIGSSTVRDMLSRCDAEIETWTELERRQVEEDMAANPGAWDEPGEDSNSG